MKLFKLQKLVIVYFLFALVGAQYALAQHSTDHLDSTNYSQQDNDDSKSDICQLCVTAKNLGQDFLVQTYLSFSVTKSKQFSSDAFEHNAHSTCNKPFQSQAPPTLFS